MIHLLVTTAVSLPTAASPDAAACQPDRCQICETGPDPAGTCCNKSYTCEPDVVFGYPICVPAEPWICHSAPNSTHAPDATHEQPPSSVAKPGMKVAKPNMNFRVCGNFCGPGWCNDGWYSEWDSDANHCGPNYGEAEISSITGEPSCADLCCRSHDECCAPGGTDLPATSGCNTELVNCLGNGNPLSAPCTNEGIPVPAGGIWAAMDLVEDWCCGHRCSESVEA